MGLRADWDNRRARAQVASILAAPGAGGWLQADGKRLRIIRAAARGGIRIDGGEGGFEERTVSELDMAWALKAQSLASVLGGAADETLVNELRYLEGTPKASTRWIDTEWVLLITTGQP